MIRSRTEVRLVVSLDTECDKGPEWRVRRPLSFANVLEGVPRRLQPLFREEGIRPTYLLSPEVIRDDACAELLGSLLAEAELGTHLHAEFVEPDASPDTDDTRAFQSDYPPRVERAKLANLTELFRSRFGRAPRSFRAGRYGIGARSLGFLEELGYAVDSSVTPYLWWRRSPMRGVSFLGAPLHAYHPSERDFRRPGRMRLLEVPVTVVNPTWDRIPRALQRAVNPLHRLGGLCVNLLGERRRGRWLRPTYATAEEMFHVSEYAVARAPRAPAILCMMLHTNEATAGASPYHADEAQVERLLERMRGYFRAMRARFEVRSIGLSEAAEVAASW